MVLFSPAFCFTPTVSLIFCMAFAVNPDHDRVAIRTFLPLIPVPKLTTVDSCQVEDPFRLDKLFLNLFAIIDIIYIYGFLPSLGRIWRHALPVFVCWCCSPDCVFNACHGTAVFFLLWISTQGSFSPNVHLLSPGVCSHTACSLYYCILRCYSIWTPLPRSFSLSQPGYLAAGFNPSWIYLFKIFQIFLALLSFAPGVFMEKVGCSIQASLNTGLYLNPLTLDLFIWPGMNSVGKSPFSQAGHRLGFFLKLSCSYYLIFPFTLSSSTLFWTQFSGAFPSSFPKPTIAPAPFHFPYVSIDPTLSTLF